jgi:hypothetical protein
MSCALANLWLRLASRKVVAVSPGGVFGTGDRLGVLRCPPQSLVAGSCGGAVVAFVSLLELALRLQVGA